MTYTVNVGGVYLLFGDWFASASEAHEWLDFECSDEELDRFDYAYPDHTCEWQRWRRHWLDNPSCLD